MEAVWSIFYGTAGTLGILHGIADAFEIPYDPNIILIWTVLFSVIWGVVSGWKQYRTYLFPSAAALFAWIGFWKWKEIREGVCRSLERATEAVNAYYQVDWQPVEYVRAGGISTEQTALLAAAVLISCLLVTGFLQKRGKICLTVLLALGFLSPFLVGQVPEDRTVWELFAAVMGLLAMQTALPGKRGQVRFSGAANGVLVGTAALAFAGGTFIVEPLLQTIFPPDSPKQKLALEELWQDIRKDSGESGSADHAKGGVGNGDLSVAGRLEPGKEPQLKVTVSGKPQSDLYLCGYIGTDYNGKRWEKLERGARDQLGRREELEERKGDSYHWLRERKEEIRLLAEYIDTEKAYEYLPYGSRVRKEQEVWGDTYIKGTGRTTYATSFCELAESDWKERMEKTCGEVLGGTSEYDRFVSEQYLKIDEKQKKKLLQIPLEGETLFAVADSMERWFGEHTTYSLSPGKVPWGEDYTEYFLFENKKGYCVHYATAATLLFRSYGIPARFVSGYLIDEEQWKAADDGAYQVTATGADAHAWTEIYTGDGIWIPVELTPGYGGSGRSEENGGSEETDRSEAAETKPENPEAAANTSQGGGSESQIKATELPEGSEGGKQQENTEKGSNPAEENENLGDPKADQQEMTEKNPAENTDAGKKGNGKQYSFVIKRIKQLFLFILISILSVISWRFYQVRKRQGIFAKSRTEKVQKIFLSLYEALRFAGMAENDCLGDEFRKEAEKVCGEMEAQLKAAQQTALKAWYSGEDISPKEERELCRIYRTVCRMIAEKLTFREKILFYFTKCFL